VKRVLSAEGFTTFNGDASQRKEKEKENERQRIRIRGIVEVVNWEHRGNDSDLAILARKDKLAQTQMRTAAYQYLWIV
jgi:hypothetical protein